MGTSNLVGSIQHERAKRVRQLKVAMQRKSQDNVRWGVLGASRFAVDKMIPAMQAGQKGTVVAIASRSAEKASAVAARFGIGKACASYEELLADAGVDAVYIPLPNHLHVPWSLRALEAGKHVLCEKPIAVTAAEAASLVEAGVRAGLLVQEAAMVRTHPRWLGAREAVRSGRIGELRALHGFFSYFNDSPENVRNQPGKGGGGLLDIGFYPVTMSRFIFESEPLRVLGLLDMDARFGVDRMASAILEFPRGHAVFTCSTQLFAHQSLDILGTQGRIGIDIPWSMPDGRESRLLVDEGARGTRELRFAACNQWGWHADLFAQAILDGAPAPVPLEDSVANLRVIDALFRSAQSGRWEQP
jgi:predicted dehydrogenase